MNSSIEFQRKSVLASSVGAKMVIALSGFFLIAFLTIHLIGNILLYVGPEAFNLYTYNLTQNRMFLYFMEVILLLGFLTHIVLTLTSTWKNRKTRNKNYQVKKTLGMSTIFSSNMGITGSLIFIFLIIHIRTFKFGEGDLVDVAGVPGAKVINMYEIVTGSFKETWYALFYIFAMILVGGHLSHGIQSAFRSLGFYNARLGKYLKIISVLFGFIIGGGFASIPIYFRFFV